MKKVTIKCPCCNAALIIDANTGLILSSKEHKKNLSFDEALKKEEEKETGLTNCSLKPWRTKKNGQENWKTSLSL